MRIFYFRYTFFIKNNFYILPVNKNCFITDKYFLTYKNNYAILDFDYFLYYLNKLLIFLQRIIKNYCCFIFMSETFVVSDFFTKIATSFNNFSFIGKWYPGILTNYFELSSNQLSSSKFVRLDTIQLNYNNIIFFFGDLLKNQLLIKEAWVLNIPLIFCALPKSFFKTFHKYITYFLPCNCINLRSIYFFSIFFFSVLKVYIKKFVYYRRISVINSLMFKQKWYL